MPRQRSDDIVVTIGLSMTEGFPEVVRWTWDPEKNDLNRFEHEFGFETAALVFNDPLLVTQSDPYRYEQRWQTMGMIDNICVIVVHTSLEVDSETGEEIGRIISARQATRHERRRYEEGTY